jgi:hypothetical protein
MSAIWWALWLQFCFVAGLASAFRALLLKTHSKGVNTAARVDNLAPVAKTANQASTNATAAKSVTDVISSNASFLSTLSSASAPVTAGAVGDTHMPTATSTYNQSDTQGAYNRINDLIDWTGFMATDYNNMRTALLTSNIIS